MVLALSGLAVWGASSPVAHGQIVQSDAASRGVFVPDGARSGTANATAVELNPAQLVFLRASAASVLVDVWRDEVRLDGRGAGLFFAAPLWSGSAFGVDLQRVLGPATSGPSLDRTKFQLAYGIGGRHLSFGASWAHLWGDAVRGIDTFDLGAGLRLGNPLALGVVVEDVGRPTASSPGTVAGVAIPGATLPRRWVAELTLRPTGTDRLNLAVAAAHVEDDDWSNVGWRFRAGGIVAGGWGLFAELALLPDVRMPAGATAGDPASARARFTAGLAFDLEHASLVAAARNARSGGDGTGDGWGAALALHQSGERNPDGLGAARMARIEVNDLESDRRFLEFVVHLRGLAFDAGFAGVWLEIDDPGLGTGRIEELRDVVAELRRHGKRVVASLTSSSMRELYLAAACDRVVLHPASILTFSGVSQSATFFKGAMDRLGVRVDLVRIAEFKGAMEPFLFQSQSEPVRANRNALIDDVFGRMFEQIAIGRSFGPERRTPASLARLLEKAEFTPAEALAAGLADAVLDDYGREGYLRQWFGRDVALETPDASPIRGVRWTRPRVAVVLVDGAINEGKSRQLPWGMGGLAGEDSVVDALDRCRRDGSVRAVVLRINSPGGSAFASDVIARAVAKLRASGKPVVASMGDVAASGGYYVAAPTDAILAEPSTITGSIGIYGFKLDLSGLLAMLSLNTEIYRRGPHADQAAPYRPWDEAERRIAEEKIAHLYGLFVKTVADGRAARGLTSARVNAIGRGQVWTGNQGKRIGLVDDFGGVTAAIEKASALAGLRQDAAEPPELVVLPRPAIGLLQKVIGLGQAAAGADVGASVDEAEAEADCRAGAGAGAIAGAMGSGSCDPGTPFRHWPEAKAILRWVGPHLAGPGQGIEARLPPDELSDL